MEDGAYVLRGERALARVEPDHGNNTTRFRVTHQGRERQLLLPRGAPILLPFPNRVPGGRYTFAGREHQLDVNERGRPNHIHGLVRGLPWVVEDAAADDRSAWVRAYVDLHAHADVVRQYPFPCRVTVTTRLADDVLVHDAEVRNVGDGPLPMGYAIHPWFPASFDGARAETAVRVGSDRLWELRERVPTGRVLEQTARGLAGFRRLDALEYDDVFTDLPRRGDGAIEAAVRYPELTISLVASASFREWVVYAPHDPEVVCVEPYTCATNAVNLAADGVDAGLIVLRPGGVWRGTVRISARW